MWKIEPNVNLFSQQQTTVDKVILCVFPVKAGDIPFLLRQATQKYLKYRINSDSDDDTCNVMVGVSSTFNNKIKFIEGKLKDLSALYKQTCTTLKLPPE